MFKAEKLTDELVQAAASGGRPERERLLQILSPRVRAMVVVRLAPRPQQAEAVEELVQQSLISISEGLEKLRHASAAALRSCASVIVARRVADYIRERPASEALKGRSLESSVYQLSSACIFRDILPATQLSPRSIAARAEQTRHVLMELGRLKEVYREVITMAFFDQLPLSEIAERMEMTRPAVSMMLMRAMKTLRRSVTGSSKVGDTDDARG